MDINWTGRGDKISDKFKDRATEKLESLVKLDSNVYNASVILSFEANPRQANTAHRVEITLTGKGKLIRSEASSDSQIPALDFALQKLEESVRREHSKNFSRNKKTAIVEPAYIPATDQEIMNSVAIKESSKEHRNATKETEESINKHLQEDASKLEPGQSIEVRIGTSPVVIREKVHSEAPMSIAEAIERMELLGHPFFVFVDKASSQPSVVYIRHAYTYGVLRLNTI